MREIFDKIFPLLTFLLGFAINWFVNRREFYWRFYREKELQLLSEMNRDIRDLCLGFATDPGPETYIMAPMFAEIGNSSSDESYIKTFGENKILLSEGLTKRFILKKYVNDAFVPENIREMIRKFTEHFRKTDKIIIESGTHLLVCDYEEIKNYYPNNIKEGSEKLTFYQYHSTYTYRSYHNDLKALKLAVYMILNKPIKGF